MKVDATRFCAGGRDALGVVDFVVLANQSSGGVLGSTPAARIRSHGSHAIAARKFKRQRFAVAPARCIDTRETERNFSRQVEADGVAAVN